MQYASQSNISLHSKIELIDGAQQAASVYPKIN